MRTMKITNDVRHIRVADGLKKQFEQNPNMMGVLMVGGEPDIVIYMDIKNQDRVQVLLSREDVLGQSIYLKETNPDSK